MSKLYNAISRLDELALRNERDPDVPDIPFDQALDKSDFSLQRMLILSVALILFGLLAVGITAWMQDWFDLHPSTNRATALAPDPPPVAAASERQAGAAEQVAAAMPLTEEIREHPSEKALPPTPPQKDEPWTSSITSLADDTPAIVINRLPAKAAKKAVPSGIQHQLPVDSITEPKPLQLVEQADAPATATGHFIDQTAQLS